MPAMPPQGPPPEAGAPIEQQEAPAADPIQIAQEVGEGLAKLADLLNTQPGASDDEKQQMAQILSSFTDLVEKKLGGGGPEQAPADQGVVPMEAGQSGKPMPPGM